MKKSTLNRILSMVLAMVMSMSFMACFANATFVSAESTKQDDISGYTVDFYDPTAMYDSTGADSRILVLTESQMFHLGYGTKQLFEYAKMLYILTSLSDKDIQDTCEMQTNLTSADTNESKFATAITMDEDGSFHFNNISALYASNPYSYNSVFSFDSVKPDMNCELTEHQQVYDGIYAAVKTNQAKLCTSPTKPLLRMQPGGFSAWATDSAVVYDSNHTRIGTMGYTIYFYKIAKSGVKRIFDAITVATFAPDDNYKCKKMSIYLGTSCANHQVIEAANITSCGQATTYSLGLQAGKDGLGGSVNTAWSYSVDAQTVKKSFDMTTNDRTWNFSPKRAAGGDAWIEEPGIRMYSTQEVCHTTVVVSCPFVSLAGVELSPNTLSRDWYFSY